ncbi:unnamed protein product [Ixodes pacificus]
MHPDYNKERRKVRAASLIKAYCDTTGVTFVDAAEYQNGHRCAAATTVGGSLKRAVSIVTQNAETAEEVAIALGHPRSGLPHHRERFPHGNEQLHQRSYFTTSTTHPTPSLSLT